MSCHGCGSQLRATPAGYQYPSHLGGIFDTIKSTAVGFVTGGPAGAVTGAGAGLVADLFEASRSGGADPCCSGHGSTPPGVVVPANANQGGAPPDFRKLTQPSPRGGRLKDDACDCIPIPWNGRNWVMGAIGPDGRIIPGGQLAHAEVQWIDVDAMAEAVVGDVAADVYGELPESTRDRIAQEEMSRQAGMLGEKVKGWLPLILGAAVIGAVVRHAQSQ